jgi:hypothetical protein
LKYTHVFDLFEKILSIALSAAAALAAAYLLISVNIFVGLGTAAAAYFGGRFLFTKILRPISTCLYLFIYCGTIVSFADAAKLSFLLDGTMEGEWWTLREIRNIPFWQRKELLYQFAQSKGAAQFSRKEKQHTRQNNYQNNYHQNTTTQQETKPAAPQYSEQYKNACSLFELKLSFSENELKESYHKLIKQYHPDLYASAAPEIKHLVEVKSRELIEGYNYLIEYNKREAELSCK